MNERYSVAERAAILGQYERSGLDLGIFAAWAGIRLSRLRAWQEQERSCPAGSPALAWIEVEIAAEEEAEGARC